MQIFKSGAPDNLRLLRVAIAARGVWELRLDSANVLALSYLRVHGGDMRHRATARLLRHDGTERPWHASPDVRPRLVPPNTLAAPSNLPWSRTSALDSNRLRQFQAALKAGLTPNPGDPRIHVNGTWDAYFSEVLRDLGAPSNNVAAAPPQAGEPALPNRDMVRIDAAFWATYTTGANAANAHASPWGAATPSEADLIDLTPSLPEGPPTEASTRLPANQDWIVEVVVAQRGRQPVDGAGVRVTLLWWVDPRTKNRARYNNVASWLPGTVPWAATVQAMLNNPLTPALNGGWHYAMPLNPAPRAILAGQTLDPLNPGVVSFRLNVGNRRNDTLVVLVAVVRSGSDVVINSVPLRDLVLNNPAVGVRAVRISN
jgi:hypothetical protein